MQVVTSARTQRTWGGASGTGLLAELHSYSVRIQKQNYKHVTQSLEKQTAFGADSMDSPHTGCLWPLVAVSGRTALVPDESPAHPERIPGAEGSFLQTADGAVQTLPGTGAQSGPSQTLPLQAVGAQSPGGRHGTRRGQGHTERDTRDRSTLPFPSVSF